MAPAPALRSRRVLWLLLPWIAVGLLLAGGGHALHADHGDLLGDDGSDGAWTVDGGDCALCGVHVAACGVQEPPDVVRWELGRAEALPPRSAPARAQRGAQRGRAPPRADGSV